MAADPATEHTVTMLRSALFDVVEAAFEGDEEYALEACLEVRRQLGAFDGGDVRLDSDYSDRDVQTPKLLLTVREIR